jgi:S-adenosylmethionine:tRNA ribosyltransferase-isomerase
MKQQANLPIQDFDYHLPDQSIAYTPTINRSDSKLLVWDKEIIAESTYEHIADFMPEKSTLFFNNSKVIAARIHFEKINNSVATNKNSLDNNNLIETNSIIEIFCLEPSAKFNPVALAMQATSKVEWICLVGGAKKWKEGVLEKKFMLSSTTNSAQDATITVQAKKLANFDGKFLIEFSWNNADISFSEIIAHIGTIPLPPYIHRNTTEADKDRYQTTYAVAEGSVAAPTAGLHFNNAIFESLATKNCNTAYITLHVGAGTFMPVKTENIAAHDMHAEFFEVTAATITQLIEMASQKEISNTAAPLIAVGTTTLRTLESLYWLGVKINSDEQGKKDDNRKEMENTDLHLRQWDAYELNDNNISPKMALCCLLNWMQSRQMTSLITTTQLMIVPGYTFKICNGLVTNFHQPKSTLLLIIAAITGNSWKLIYQHALDNQYRFLSYGDGCYFTIK